MRLIRASFQTLRGSCCKNFCIAPFSVLRADGDPLEDSTLVADKPKGTTVVAEEPPAESTLAFSLKRRSDDIYIETKVTKN